MNGLKRLKKAVEALPKIEDKSNVKTVSPDEFPRPGSFEYVGPDVPVLRQQARPPIQSPAGEAIDMDDPPVGSREPWSARELSLLALGVDALEIMRADGERLPSRVASRLDGIEHRSDLDELAWLNG